MAPSTALTGKSLNPCTVSGLELSCTSYRVPPIWAVPAGIRTLLCSTACTTSLGESPFAATRPGSMSTMICRYLPPKGAGVERPGMVNRRRRMKFSPWSNSSCSERVFELMVSCATGTFEAL